MIMKLIMNSYDEDELTGMSPKLDKKKLDVLNNATKCPLGKHACMPFQSIMDRGVTPKLMAFRCLNMHAKMSPEDEHDITTWL